MILLPIFDCQACLPTFLAIKDFVYWEPEANWSTGYILLGSKNHFWNGAYQACRNVRTRAKSLAADIWSTSSVSSWLLYSSSLTFQIPLKRRNDEKFDAPLPKVEFIHGWMCVGSNGNPLFLGSLALVLRAKFLLPWLFSKDFKKWAIKWATEWWTLTEMCGAIEI